MGLFSFTQVLDLGTANSVIVNNAGKICSMNLQSMRWIKTDKMIALGEKQADAARRMRTSER